jgi:hypothetical protein
MMHCRHTACNKAVYAAAQVAADVREKDNNLQHAEIATHLTKLCIAEDLLLLLLLLCGSSTALGAATADSIALPGGNHVSIDQLM